MAEQTTSRRQLTGTLFLIGGRANMTLKRFVELAGGKAASIVIIPHASGVAEETCADLHKAFDELGAGLVTSIMPPAEGDTIPQRLPAGTNAVYITGGDQKRLIELVSPELLSDIIAVLDNGGVVAGTSAGTAAAAETMVARGMDSGIIDVEALELSPGFSLAPGFVFDTHVGERDRQNRLTVAIHRLPSYFGIGLDEDTAVELTASGAVVSGKGLARFYRLPKGSKNLLENVQLTELADGQTWTI